MDLLIKNFMKVSDYTIGKLYVDGDFFSFAIYPTEKSISLKGKFKVSMKNKVPEFELEPWSKPYSGKIPCIEGVDFFHIRAKASSDEEIPSKDIILGNLISNTFQESSIKFMSLMEKHLYPAMKKKSEIFITFI